MDETKFLDLTALNFSRLFHPFIATIPLGLLFLYLAELTVVAASKWVLISAAITLVPTAAFLKLHPEYTLREVNNRENRNLIYTIGVIETIILTAAFWFLNAPSAALALLYSFILLIAVGGTINRFEKVSVHVGFLSAFSTAIAWFSLKIGLIGFLATLVILWSRIRLDRHTPIQVILGLFVPIICVSIVFQIFLF